MKKLVKNHTDIAPLIHVMQLILLDSAESKTQLHHRHNAHALQGDLSGVYECHIDNAADWLLLWERNNTIAVFLRTGKHDEVL
ncbi:MAG: type II toxin-antitoxin system YafQ family toxin [Bifidobacterium tibiigranuli]|jgi:mRNA interferase YafQ|nr:type II toxin-antitoxin system YafQ family toxin [Bifidobacterium tibiigranuli]MCI1673280.1 type II toxin-antitoxin system YafQ family toxin [Bifidobacterium tibiigranuli]MCI1712609.1 type II toxin-antitoxin system YafQ family toxin [Bifidobacterium tibiigranuli]MCI1833782.1 type II toxin-antitoxin system YafQ family toxin [Bifidobacterium tibiigranuli]MCI2185310.1 type II toxin-antitoxin system YafQ family toxin [Bifidobacterium tibiigranuli]